MTLLKSALACILVSSMAALGQTQGGQAQNSGSPPLGGASGGNAPNVGGTRGGQGTTSPPSPGTQQPPTRDRTRDTNPRDTQDTTRRSTANDRLPQMQTPVYLHGRVVTNDGEAPPRRVVVKLNCGNRSTPQGYTDRKGYFNFQPGSNRSIMMADASVRHTGHPGRMTGLTVGSSGSANLSQCHLVAELPGYRSDRVTPGMLRMGSNDVGLIVLHRLEGLVGNTVSITALSAPSSARKAYQKGLKALRMTKPNREAAIRHLEKAVEAHPVYAEAWAALGEARRGLEQEDRARTAYARSIEADPKFLLPYEPLMDLALNRRDWNELGSLSARYLELSPRSSKARFFSALAAASTSDMARAESLVKSMAELNEKHEWPLSYVITALVHEARAEWEPAASEYRAYIDVALDQKSLEMAKRKLHEWEMLRIIEPRGTIVAGTDQP